MLDIAGLIAGPLIGFLGGLVNQVAAYKNKQLDLQLEEMRSRNALEMESLKHAHTKDIAIIEQEGRERLTEMEGEITLRQEDMKNLANAFNNDRATYLPPGAAVNNKIVIFMLALVDFIRGMIRPAITVFLVYTLWHLNVSTLTALQKLSPSAIDLLLPNIVEASTFGVIQLALTAVGYWFGSRSSAETFIVSRKK